MRQEFQIHATRPGNEDCPAIVFDTVWMPLECACEIAEDEAGEEPHWARFFSEHRVIMAPNPPYGRERLYTAGEALAAIAGMRSALSGRAAAWAADMRWPNRWPGPEDLVATLDRAAETVQTQPAGTRFETFVQIG